MIKKITQFLSSVLAIEPEELQQDYRVAIVALLFEVSYADHEVNEQEANAIEHTLMKLLCVDKAQADQLMEIAEQECQASNSVYDFTSQLADLDQATRIQLIEAMWEIAYADQHLDSIEEAIIRRVAKLLYVDHSEFIRTKLKVKKQLNID